MEQPTWWEWVVFLVSMALTVYAFVHLAVGLLSRGRAEERAVPVRRRWSHRHAPWPLRVLGALGRLADWLIYYLYLPLWRGFVGALRALWSGPPQPAEAGSAADQPATVSIISVPLPAAYVAANAETPHQNAPSAPSAVRPSAPSAPDRPSAPDIPPAIERLMVDRSREALVEALVAAGWSTTQIRGQLRGANDAIGPEVEAARARLAAPRATPVAGRALADGVEFRD